MITFLWDKLNEKHNDLKGICPTLRQAIDKSRLMYTSGHHLVGNFEGENKTLLARCDQKAELTLVSLREILSLLWRWSMSNVVDFTQATRASFIRRFTLYMIMSDSSRVIPGFVSVFDYARHAAAAYWDQNVDRLNPEQCAEADMSFWPTDFPAERAQH